MSASTWHDGHRDDIEPAHERSTRAPGKQTRAEALPRRAAAAAAAVEPAAVRPDDEARDDPFGFHLAASDAGGATADDGAPAPDGADADVDMATDPDAHADMDPHADTETDASAETDADAADPHAAFGAAMSGAGPVPFRAEMEASFGDDLSGVQAALGRPAEMASLGAHAASRGEQVAFASASPDKELVAHELTHVMQHRQAGGGEGAVHGKRSIGAAGDAAELEADAVAARVVDGARVAVRAAPGGGLQLARYKKGDKVVLDTGKLATIERIVVDSSVESGCKYEVLVVGSSATQMVGGAKIKGSPGADTKTPAGANTKTPADANTKTPAAASTKTAAATPPTLGAGADRKSAAATTAQATTAGTAPTAATGTAPPAALRTPVASTAATRTPAPASDVGAPAFNFKDLLHTFKTRFNELGGDMKHGQPEPFPEIPPALLAEIATRYGQGGRGSAKLPVGLVRQLVGAPATQGKVAAHARPSSDGRGFTLVMETFHWGAAKGGNDQVTLALKLNPNTGAEKTLDIHFPVVVCQDHQTQTIVNISFADMARLIKPTPIGSDVLVYVVARFQKPNASADLGHTSIAPFAIPYGKASGIRRVDQDFGTDVPINLPAPDRPRRPPAEVVRDHDLVEDTDDDARGRGSELTSSLETEAEYRLPTDPSSQTVLEKAVIDLYAMCGDAKRREAAFGAGWNVIAVDKYILKDKATGAWQASQRPAFASVANADGQGHPIGAPGPLTDTYYDTKGLDILRTGASLRTRENFRKADLLNVKGPSIPGADPGGSTVRLCSNLQLKPKAGDALRADSGGSRGKLRALVNDPQTGPLHTALTTCLARAQRGPSDGPIIDSPLGPVLRVESERHRFRIFRDGGANIELSIDFSTGQRLDAKAQPQGQPRPVYGFELGLEHMGASARDSKHEDGGGSPDGMGSATAAFGVDSKTPQPTGETPQPTGPISSSARAVDAATTATATGGSGGAPLGATQASERLHQLYDLGHPSLVDPRSGRNKDFLDVRDAVMKRYFAGAGARLAGYKPSQLMQDFGEMPEVRGADHWPGLRVPPRDIPSRAADALASRAPALPPFAPPTAAARLESADAKAIDAPPRAAVIDGSADAKAGDAPVTLGGVEDAGPCSLHTTPTVLRLVLKPTAFDRDDVQELMKRLAAQASGYAAIPAGAVVGGIRELTYAPAKKAAALAAAQALRELE